MSACATRYDCGSDADTTVTHRGDDYDVCFGCYFNRLEDWEREN